MAALLDLKQLQSGCDDKVGGQEKWWLCRFADISALTFTAKAGTVLQSGTTNTAGYEISAITMASTTGFAEVAFSDNKTAFINETAGNPGEANAIQASCEFEGLDAASIHWANLLKKECAIVLVGQNKSGIIRLYGIEPIDITANTFKKCQDPLRAKISTVSGNGGGDYEKMTVEIVGGSKSLAYSTKAGTLDADDFDALNFS